MTTREIVDAKKKRMNTEEVLKLARRADQLYVSKGKTSTHFDLKRDKPTDQELLSVMLGPTGNLRAPTLLVGKALLVGFNEESYKKVLGD